MRIRVRRRSAAKGARVKRTKMAIVSEFVCVFFFIKCTRRAVHEPLVRKQISTTLFRPEPVTSEAVNLITVDEAPTTVSLFGVDRCDTPTDPIDSAEQTLEITC